jgi:MFS superfamily sulfate permease-like transporter
MRAIIWIFFFHLIGLAYYVLITDLSFAVTLAILLSFAFCVLPMFFATDEFEIYVKKQSDLCIDGTGLKTFAFFLLIPLVILVYERVKYGFEITLNPVVMRDQMLQRHRDGDGGGILAIIGNLLNASAMYFFFKYLLLEKTKTTKTLISGLYILGSAWIAGSRALLLLMLLILWTKNGLKFPSRKNLLILGVMFFALTYVFVLRADRSDIEFTAYMYRIFDHLRISYDYVGATVISSILGPVFLSIGYIVHSVESLGCILLAEVNRGISLSPLNHFYNIFSELDNSEYGYHGLFITSFGLFYHDLGALGASVILAIKCLVMYYASRMKDSFLAMSIVLILTVDSVMGLWTSVINLLFVSYIIIALVFIALFQRIRFNFRKKY